MKKNKYVVYILILAIVLTSLFTLVACDLPMPGCRHFDKNKDGLCDKCGEKISASCNHVDKNTDGKCDRCGKVIGDCVHEDGDEDGKCDKCGEKLKTECVHEDKNSDGKCDKCGATVGTCSHIDENTDGKCDKCGDKIGECSHDDADGNGFCDKCNEELDKSCVHIDVDNDGKCDSCKISVLVDFDFYAINDLHGTYVTNSTQTGVEGLTAYLLNAQASGNAYVLSSGDMWQGGSESNNTHGKVGTKWMNYVNCVSMTLGNHEFDWSTDAIKLNATLADFPFLAINVYNRATNERVEYCDSSIMIEKDGAKIGIIGAIGDCYSSISSSMCEDVYFKVGSELTTLVKAESQKLRNQGADYIIYSLHDGKGSNQTASDIDNWYDSALSNGYVDVVFEAHSHQSYTLTDKNSVKHIQAGGYNSGVSHADVKINFANGSSITSVNVVSSGTYASQYGTDDKINDIVEIYRDEVGNPDEVIGTNSTYRNSTYLCDTMAQLYYDKGVAVWGNDYDIALGGGFLQARSPYNLYVGDVTTRKIQTLFPFENTIVLCSIKGSDLKAKFFNTTNTRYHIAYGDYGESVKTKLNSGQGLSDTYYVVVDTYTLDYKYNNLTKVASLSNTYPYHLMIEYAANGGFAQ